MKKTVTMSLLAISLLSGATFAWAKDVRPSSLMEMRGKDNAEKFAERLAKFKTALALKPDQESKWADYESAMRAQMEQRKAMQVDSRAMRDSRDTMSHPERMAKRADMMGKMADGMKKVVAAMKPLYDSFDASQKATFDKAMNRMNRMGGKRGNMTE